LERLRGQGLEAAVLQAQSLQFAQAIECIGIHINDAIVGQGSANKPSLGQQ